MTPITVTKEGARWIARFAFDWDTKDVVKTAGFIYSPTEKLWYTTNESIARRLDPATAEQAAIEANRAIALSRATNIGINIPAPDGLAYLPYQLAGIAYTLPRPQVLIGDEMGLGKTIQAIGVINASPEIKRVLVVCPASLKINWARELNKWLVRATSIEIANGKFPRSNIVIINYDILVKHRAAIDAVNWDLLIVDEAHYVKNNRAQRTQALLGKYDRDPAKVKAPIKAKRRIFLTGTPIVNLPAELWSIVNALDPDNLGRSFMGFMRRYTNAQHNGYGWDFTGAANLDELQTRMRANFMVRRLKADVLSELPAKRRQVVIVPPNGASSVITAERNASERSESRIGAAARAVAAAREAGDADAYAVAVKQLRDARKIAFEEMAKLRHDTAVAKIPHVIEHLTDCLENEDKVVVFVHHHDVAHALKEAFPTAAVVTGETKVGQRQLEVDRFQHDPNCRLFIGSIHAAGVGLTLTAAQLVVFAELDWVPGNISQAEDRLHRIGQRGSVLVQHLVFENSIDARMANVIIEKQEVIDAALDDPTKPVEISEEQRRAMEAPEVAAAANTAPLDTTAALIDDEEIPF